MTTPHAATGYTNPAQSSPAETEAAQLAEVEASAGLYDRSFKSTKEQYQDLTGTQEPTPTVSGIDPTTAQEGSGPVTVTVTGTGFIAESVVLWGSEETALEATVNSSTEIEVDVPDEVAGDYDLVVDNGESKASDAVTFTYSAAE
jgi:hypothetical protein